MDRLRAEKLLRDSLERLIVQHWELAELGVGERSVTSYLFLFLATHECLPTDLRVDHEYNRMNDKSKQINKARRSSDVLENPDDHGARRIFPDLIIHKRNNNEHNMLAIEVKRCGGSEHRDKLKLIELLKEPYHYCWCVVLDLGITDAGWDPSWLWTSEAEGDQWALPFTKPKLDKLNERGRRRRSSR